MEKYEEIEKTITKRFRKEIWKKFVKAICDFEMISEGDKIAVCISGGKDSMLMAKCFQELKKHRKMNFELEFIVMNPGYNELNKEKIISNSKLLNIPITMFETDIFGRSLWETVDVPAETMDITHEDGTIETVEIRSACIETHQKLNPNYNNDEEYLPRSDRPEWDAVGMMGKLVAVDDGTCEVNGWCTVGMGGIAVKSDARTRYRVMARLDDTHIRILIL